MILPAIAARFWVRGIVQLWGLATVLALFKERANTGFRS